MYVKPYAQSIRQSLEIVHDMRHAHLQPLNVSAGALICRVVLHCCPGLSRLKPNMRKDLPYGQNKESI